jgi:hypothetical protein
MEEHVRQGLQALAEKYRVLARMRAEGSSVEPAHARAQMAALAARFPGALRELDELPEVLIASRLEAIERALDTREPERWMRLQISYHGVMRAALRIRRLLREQGAPIEPGVLDTVGYAAADDEPSPESLDLAALTAIVRPVGGRLNPWVFEQVARAHGVEAAEVRAALFLR